MNNLMRRKVYYSLLLLLLIQRWERWLSFLETQSALFLMILFLLITTFHLEMAWLSPKNLPKFSIFWCLDKSLKWDVWTGCSNRKL